MPAVFLIALLLGGCVDTHTIGEDKTYRSPLPGSGKALKPALLRLEDVGPGGPYESGENLHKLYAVAEYLHQEGVPFHISVIPRLVVPKRGYDATMADDTPYSRQFITTLKNMEKLGGVVGIHGYTHQSGNDPSAWGFEFYDLLENPRVPNTYEFARDRMDKAFSLFEKAGVTPAYWETPHYTASVKQHPAFEEQMGLLYENKHRGEVANTYKVVDFTGRGYRGYVTVPAPLGNIDRDSDVEKMIKKLDHLGNDLASFFYHPFREFKFLYKDHNAKGEAYYVYDQNSPLHTLIRAFKEKGYTFVSIYSLVQFVPAHRLEAVPLAEGGQVLAGRFSGSDRNSFLVWNAGAGEGGIYDYTADWYSPRRKTAFSKRQVKFGQPSPETRPAPLVGDFNGDGKDDLLLFGPGPATLRLAENRGDKFVYRGAPVSLAGIISASPLAGDFNGDGLADLAVYDREGGRLGLALRMGGGFRQIRWQGVEEAMGQNLRAFAGDFNGDGKDDVILQNSASGQWTVLLSGGKIFVSAGIWMTKWGIGDAWRPFVADANGDGLSDLILYHRTGHWQVALSDGRRFVHQGDFGPWGASQKGLPVVADFNGDGKSDLAIMDEVKGKGYYSLDLSLSVMYGP